MSEIECLNRALCMLPARFHRKEYEEVHLPVTYLDQKLKVEAFGTLIFPHSYCNDAAHQCLHNQSPIASRMQEDDKNM